MVFRSASVAQRSSFGEAPAACIPSRLSAAQAVRASTEATAPPHLPCQLRHRQQRNDVHRWGCEHHHERKVAGWPLTATALIHESNLRLLQGEPDQWENRRHFIAAAAEAMRRILVEHARRKKAFKRGGRQDRVGLDDDHLPPIASPCGSVEDLLSLNDALDQLSKEDPAKAELVKLLYFAGLNLAEAAAALDISRTSAYRQ